MLLKDFAFAAGVNAGRGGTLKYLGLYEMQEVDCEKFLSGESQIPNFRYVRAAHKEAKRRAPKKTPFSCSHCGKMFRTVAHMRVHIDAVHLKNKQAKPKVACSICRREYTSNYSLSRHWETKHAGMPGPRSTAV